MQLSRDYIIERLENTSVDDLARELAEKAAAQYPKTDIPKTIEKFKAMLKPLAPVEVKATDLARSMGIDVIEVQ